MDNLKETIVTENNFHEILECYTANEVEEAYKLSEVLNYPYTNFSDTQRTCVFQGDLHIAGIDAGRENDWNAFNLVVMGDLIVDGDIDWSEYSNGSFLYVKGNLKARNILLKGCPEIHICGDLEVENGIIGHHGDDGGFLKVDGSVKAKLIMCLTYFGMKFASQPKAVTVGDISGDCESDFDEDELEEILAGKLWNKSEGYAEDHLIAEAIRNGKPVLKASALPAAQAVLKKLDKMLEKAEKVTEIDLKEKKLKKIPDQIFEFPNLKKLTLDKNQIKKLPAKIRTLSKLEELNLRESGISELPPEIGELPSLKVLNLLYNRQLAELPAELGNLQNLETLWISGVSDLPAEFGKLKNLKKLLLSDLGQCAQNNYTGLPSVVFEMTGLTELRIICYNYTFLEMPMDIVKLTKLEMLELPLRHTSENGFPELSQLKNLKSLEIDGWKCPDISILTLPQIWNCSTLRELNLSRWGDREQYNPETQKHEIVRPGVEKLPDDAFAGMPNLEVLSVNFSKSMSDMPKSFYELKHLKEVYFDHMNFSVDVKEKIRNAFPNAQINF